MNATRRRMSWMHRAPVCGVLLTLTLLFAPWSGVPAAENTEQEIGRPVPMPTKDMGCFSGVLLPNKDGFYTVRDGLLSEYQIKPFKRVRSVELEWDAYKASGLKGCRIWTTGDQSKVIIYNKKMMFLLDANNGRLLNSSPLPDETGVFTAQIDGEEILMLVGPDYSNRNMDKKDCYQLVVWDLNTLRHKKSIQLGEHAGIYVDMSEGPRMSVTDGKIYLMSNDVLVVLNRQNYTPELRVNNGSRSRALLFPDLNRLQFDSVEQIFDITQNKVLPIANNADTSLIFNQRSRAYEEVKKVDTATLIMQSVKPIVGYNNFSKNSDTWMRGSSIYPSMRDLSYEFYQYAAGEAVMMHCNFVNGAGRKCGSFEMTPNARKYMQMKVNDGTHVPSNEIKTLPINDATLDKYYIKGVTD